MRMAEYGYGTMTLGLVVLEAPVVNVISQQKDDSRNHGVLDPCVYVSFWAPIDCLGSPHSRSYVQRSSRA